MGKTKERGDYSLLSAGSWAMYDFANTIFSATCVTLFFPIYLEQIAGSVTEIGTANVVSMIAAGFMLPIAGGIIDRTGRAKSWLLVLTVMCCGATAFLSAFTPLPENVYWLMGAFIAANFSYQVSLVFYNSLITSVVPEDRVGFISGLGVGLGYAGIVFAMLVLWQVTSVFGLRWAFVTAAILFFVFSLPLFFFVREREVDNPEKLGLHTAAEALRKAGRTIRSVCRRRKILVFFLGNFLVVDALNTAIVYFSVYIKNVFGKDTTEIIIQLIGFYTGALVWGILQGKACDRFGAKPVYMSAAVMLVFMVAVCALVRSELVFFATLIGAGSFALAGVWTAGRKMLVEISPEEDLGEFFGLYGMTGRFSAFGTVFFGIIADAAGYRLALLALLATSVPGALLLSMVKPEKVHVPDEGI